jgi:hypothetical protein
MGSEEKTGMSSSCLFRLLVGMSGGELGGATGSDMVYMKRGMQLRRGDGGRSRVV